MWYHGGPAGLRKWIRPPTETDAKDTVTILADSGLDTSVVRRDRVFLTSSYDAAVMFAAVHRKPMVYEVEPFGEVEPDPDFYGEPGVSVQTTRARIRRTIRPSGRLVTAIRRVLAGEEKT